MLQYALEEVGWAKPQQQTHGFSIFSIFQVGGFSKNTTKHGWITIFNDQYCVVCEQDLFHTCEADKIFCTKLGAIVECLRVEIECRSAEVISAWLEVTPKL